MRYLNLAGRLFGGIVFIFSGFVKGIDPAGTQIKFSDYLAAAGISLPDNILLVAAMMLCASEFLIGISLITGSFYKLGVIGFLIFMGIFTPLTLILAIYNPVSDCGCFGDAVHLTNWQTFLKNLILIVPGILLAFLMGRFPPAIGKRHSTIIAAITIVMFTGFMLHNIRYNPIIDFRPYKIGTNIPESMSIPANAPQPEFDVTFLYKKDDVVKEFTIENYPAGDSTWEFVDQKSVIKKKGYEPPIKDLFISTVDGIDITNLIIQDRGYTLLMISHNLLKADRKEIEAGMSAGFNCAPNNISFYVITGSSASEIESYRNGLNFGVADKTLLKTIVRTNPGYILIKDGTIIGKWSAAGLPPVDYFATDPLANTLRYSNNLNAVFVIVLYLLVSAILFLVADRYLYKSLKN